MFKAIFFLIFLLSISGCQEHYKPLNIPIELDDGWEVAAIGKENFEEQQLEQLVGEVPATNAKLDALVIIRNGKLVVDEYFNGYSQEKLHKTWSITKSVTGILLGIAQDKGLLSINDPFHQYLPNYSIDSASLLNNITIEHLITMTSGLEWEELGGPQSSGYKLPYASDWIDFVLKQPIVAPPGEQFNYSTGNTMLLAPVIKQATQLQANIFGDSMLFKPLNISNYQWDSQSEFWSKTVDQELKSVIPPQNLTYKNPFAQLTNTGSGLKMRPRDLAKIGQLFLDKGTWNNNQLVSKSWAETSTKTHFQNKDYCYLWRTMNFGKIACFYASGFGLQRIFVFPSKELVIVLTQHHYQSMPEGNMLTLELVTNILKTIKE